MKMKVEDSLLKMEEFRTSIRNFRLSSFFFFLNFPNCFLFRIFLFCFFYLICVIYLIFIFMLLITIFFTIKKCYIMKLRINFIQNEMKNWNEIKNFKNKSNIINYTFIIIIHNKNYLFQIIIYFIDSIQIFI